MLLCRRCHNRFNSLLAQAGSSDQQTTTTTTVVSATSDKACASCHGLYQRFDANVDTAVDAVMSSPYVDYVEIAVNSAISRPTALLHMSAAHVFVGDRAHRPEAWDALQNFKDACSLDYRNAVVSKLQQRLSRSVVYAAQGEGLVAALCFTLPDTSYLYDKMPSTVISNKSNVVLSRDDVNRYVTSHVPPAEYTMDGHLGHVKLDVRVSHMPLFLYGRYTKHFRDLSQSPWFCDGVRVGSLSLQEHIADPIIEMFYPTGMPSVGVQPIDDFIEDDHPTAKRRNKGGNKGLQQGRASSQSDPVATARLHVKGYDHYKFHSAGREDVDVRMLGKGRPFVLEILSPHRQFFNASELLEMEHRINSQDCGVSINQLRIMGPSIVPHLGEQSESKRKWYRCMVWSSRAIATWNGVECEAITRVRAMKDVAVKQRTPIRVLHRRSLLDRERVIHSIDVRVVNPHWMVVDLETQAGTYVKEFIHGDSGRTNPNFGDLIGSVTDIIQLDVTGIEYPEGEPCS